MSSGIVLEFDASHHAVVVLLGLGAILVLPLFHVHRHSFPVGCQPSCSGSFAWLGSHPSLAARKGATVEVVLPTCHKCSSKLCLLFGPFGPTSLQQRQLRKNHNFWDSHQLAGSKLVLSRDHVVQKNEAVKL